MTTPREKRGVAGLRLKPLLRHGSPIAGAVPETIITTLSIRTAHPIRAVNTRRETRRTRVYRGAANDAHGERQHECQGRNQYEPLHPGFTSFRNRLGVSGLPQAMRTIHLLAGTTSLWPPPSAHRVKAPGVPPAASSDLIRAFVSIPRTATGYSFHAAPGPSRAGTAW